MLVEKVEKFLSENLKLFIFPSLIFVLSLANSRLATRTGK
jgi:hypothetical protein